MSLPQLAPADSQLSFMDLPREIRDEIYLAVLQTPAPPPASPEDAGPQDRGYDIHLHTEMFWYVYPVCPRFRYASQNLLGCNHQINSEVREILARHDKPGVRGLDFKLDVLVHHGELMPTDIYHHGGIVPTWALVPGPVSHARNLEIDMRMLGRCYKDALRDRIGRWAIFEVVLELLSRVFQFGPPLFGECLTDNELRVETVTLIISWSNWPENLPHKHPAVHKRPCSGSSLKYRLAKLVLRKARSTESQREPWSVSQGSWRVSKIMLNNDKEVEELSARDRELAQKIVTIWDSYDEHFRWSRHPHY